MKHKHADIIHAWADGAEIEIYSESACEWVLCIFPSFHAEMLYRVKEKPKYKFTIGLYKSLKNTAIVIGVPAVIFLIDNFLKFISFFTYSFNRIFNPNII